MAELTVENLYHQIAQLPQPERFKLWRMLEPVAQPEPLPHEPPLPQLPPRALPNKDRELQWLLDHARDYVGQWVALDGDRLIAHGPEAKAVYAAANADGAYLPLVTQVEDPDRLFIF